MELVEDVIQNILQHDMINKKYHANNVSTAWHYNFYKMSTSIIDSMGSPYDIRSIMHYNSMAGSINGKPVITDLNGNKLNTQVNTSKIKILMVIFLNL